MNILVTGAAGFLGRAFAMRMLEQGSVLGVERVRGAGRNRDAGLVERGAEFVVGDLADPEAARAAVEGMNIVIHCAGRSGLGGGDSIYRRANVTATAEVLAAAKAAGVRRIVNIGTPSIYFDYTDTLNRAEDYRPARMPDAYAATKLEAEELLLAANGDGIETISLRPRFTSGRGDTNILGRFVRMHREGKLKRVGEGKNVVDFTALSNMVDAMWLAATAPAEACGVAYNITNGDPVEIWPFLDRVMEKVGLPPITASVSYPIAAAAATVIESACALFGKQPPITRLGPAVMAKSMTMSIEAARDRLGYVPRQTNEEMLDEFVEGCKEAASSVASGDVAN